MNSQALTALRQPSFAWYLAARTISLAGSSMAPVALAFAVLHVDSRPSSLAQVLGVRVTATLLFLLVGGVISDRLSPVAVLRAGHAVTFFSQGVAAYLIISGDGTVAALTIIEAVNGAATAFTMPAMMGIVPLVTERSTLPQANALVSMSRSTTQVAGPALAGLMVATTGPGWALAADAATYGIALWCLGRIRLGQQRGAPVARSSMLSDVAAGWREFTVRSWVWIVVVTFAVLNAIHVGSITVLGATIANHTPSIGSKGWGLALSLEAAGTVIMTAVLVSRQPARPVSAGLVAMALYSLPILALAAQAPLPVIAAGFAVAGAGGAVFAIGWETSLQQHVPQTALGKVASYDALGSLVALPAGMFLYGWLPEHVAETHLLVMSAGAYVLVVATSLLSPSVRGVRRAGVPAHNQGAN